MEPTPEEVAEPVNPILVVVRLLRGRMLVAMVLGLLLAVPAGVIVYSSVAPVYTSQGIVQVKPVLSSPMGGKDSPDTGLMPMFNSFLATQATFIGSRSVLEQAILDTDLIQAGWPASGRGVARLEDELGVKHGDHTLLIEVTVTDKDPETARIALNAILRAYESIYIREKDDEIRTKDATLDRRSSELEAEINHLQAQIEDITLQLGPDSLANVHDRRVSEMEQMRETLQKVDREITQKKADPEHDAVTPEAIRVQQLLATDNQLEAFMLTRSRYEQQLAALRQRGIAERHPEYRTLQNQIELINRQIAARERQLKRFVQTGVLDTNVNTGEQDDPKTQLKRLVSLREELLAGYQKLQQEVQDLGRRRSQVRQLQHDLDSVRKDYEETTSRLDMLRINTRNTPGRINIAMWGTKPTGPSTDKRSAMALGAAMGAGVFGFVLVPLLAFLRRRFSYSDETESLAGCELMGVLPHIDRSNLVTQHRAEIAVQHLRNNLQLVTSSEHVVIAIGGSEGNEGVTSLVMALAVAMAESGSSVVVVDANLNSPDLTQKMSMADRYGLREMMSRADGPDLAQLSRFILGTAYSDVAVLPVGQDMTAVEKVANSGVVIDTIILRKFDVVNVRFVVCMRFHQFSFFC